MDNDILVLLPTVWVWLDYLRIKKNKIMYKITEEQKKVIEKGLLTAIDNGTDDEFTSQEMHLINDAFELVNNLTIPDVNHQRELLKAYEMFVNKDAYNKLEDPINKIIEKFLAFNCG
jgi:hypothetical protein